MEKVWIEYVPISELRSWPGNPKRHDIPAITIAPPDRAPARVAVDMRDFPRANPPPKIKAPADFFGRILQLPLDLG